MKPKVLKTVEYSKTSISFLVQQQKLEGILRQLGRRRNCETRKNWMEPLFSFRSSDLTDEVRKKTITDR
jgi:hypothetical protein